MTRDTRAAYGSDALRHSGDLADAEWQAVAALLPLPTKTALHRAQRLRELINAMSFLFRGCCPWCMPK